MKATDGVEKMKENNELEYVKSKVQQMLDVSQQCLDNNVREMHEKLSLCDRARIEAYQRVLIIINEAEIIAVSASLKFS